MKYKRAIATLFGLSCFMAGAAVKEAWMTAGYPLHPDRGTLDAVAAAWLAIVAERIAAKARKAKA